MSFLRRALALLVAASLAVSGAALAAPGHQVAAVAAPVTDCLHHAGRAGPQAHEHGDQGGDHSAKQSCHCALTTCSGWSLAPAALTLVDLDVSAFPHRIRPALAFRPHPPGVPLQPPRL